MVEGRSGRAAFSMPARTPCAATTWFSLGTGSARRAVDGVTDVQEGCDNDLRVRSLLMFQGRAAGAMSFYVSLFSVAEIISDERYGAGRVGAEGSVRVARFRIGGLTVRCIDSPVRHDFTLTPAISRFIDCESADDLDRKFAAFSEGDMVFMPLSNYGFSHRFGLINDCLGVSRHIRARSDQAATYPAAVR